MTDAIIAVSQYIADALRDGAGVAAERLHIVPGGVDLDRFRPPTTECRARGREILGIDSDVSVIGIVSRLAPIAAFWSCLKPSAGLRRIFRAPGSW